MEKKRSLMIRLLIRALAILIIAYSLLMCMFLGMGPGATPFYLGLSVFGSFISSVGMIMLKRWSRYSTLVFMGVFFIFIFYEGLIKYHHFNIVAFIKDSGMLFPFFPLVIICFLYLPKVKEQFKKEETLSA